MKGNEQSLSIIKFVFVILSHFEWQVLFFKLLLQLSSVSVNWKGALFYWWTLNQSRKPILSLTNAHSFFFEGQGALPHNVQDLSSLTRDLCPLQWKCRILSTGPPGKSHVHFLFKHEDSIKQMNLANWDQLGTLHGIQRGKIILLYH